MMTGPLDLYVFGDQTYDLQPHLKELLSNRSNPILEEFLVNAYDAVRIEIYRLPPQVRDGLPRFTCVDDLILWDQSGSRCIALDMAVTCIYQVGTFIIRTHSNHYPSEDARVLGLCTGALAATAVACSSSLLDLIPLGINVVKAAFRIGMRVADVAHRLAPMEVFDRSWSIIMPGLHSEAIEHFCGQSASTNPYQHGSLQSANVNTRYCL